MALRTFGLSFIALSISALVSTSAFAGTAGMKGICMANGQQMQLNNDQVLNWKTSTANGWHGRGFVKGTLTKAYNDKSGHNHFEMQIGQNSSDLIEIIYNQGFGELPNLRSGDSVVVCGDYITSRDRNGGYPASPDGAIIHWVHGSPNGRHADGFVQVNGTIYGNGGDATRGNNIQNMND